MKKIIPTLLEVFGLKSEAPVDDDGQPLRTADPFAPPVQNKAKNSSFGSIRATPKSNNDMGTLAALTDPNIKPVNVAAPGYKKPKNAGFKTPSNEPITSITPDAPQGSQAKGTGGSKAQYAKPNYKGSYVGQTWTTNDKTVAKNTAWKGPQGDPRFGKVHSMQKVSMVWDGNDWVHQDEFDRKVRMGQLKKK